MDNKTKWYLFGIVLFCVLALCSQMIAYAIAIAFGHTDTRFTSESIDDAKKKGTYICPVKAVVSTSYSSGFASDIRDGWLEKKWYYHKDTVVPLIGRYCINLMPKIIGDKIQTHVIYCPLYGSHLYYMGPTYISKIDSLPIEDTLKYYVMKESPDEYNFKDFKKNHIIDSILIILDK